MTLTDQPLEKPSFLEKPILAAMTINWELVLYGTIFIVALVTRFYDLGTRVMSHDESLHALFSFKLYDGDGYTHDPLMHGPLQFHLVALSYLLFGDNDFTARIPVALAGVALTILPFWFRPWLGRIGALVTSFGLLISPSLLYYERYIRNESYILLFTALLALALFQYMRTRQALWLYWGAAAVALSLASKEVALIHGFIGVLFLVGAWLWERLSVKNRQPVQLGIAGVAFVILLIAAILANVNPEDSTFDGSRYAGILLMVFGLIIALFTISLNTDRQNRPVSQTILSFDDPISMLFGPVIMVVAIFILLHTTFFTNPNGVITGTWGAVSYWLAQQEVERGSQPGYYYLLLMLLYEFLPFFIGGIGGIYYLIRGAPSHTDPLDAEALRRQAAALKRKTTPASESSEAEVTTHIYPSDGGTFVAYLIVWAIGSLVIYSWAGEKMPWLNTHIALPFIFLMGHVTQTIINNFDWSIFKTRAGFLFAVMTPLLGAALMALFSLSPFQGRTQEELRSTSQFFAALIMAAAIGYGVWWYARQLKRATIGRILFIVAFSLMSVFTIRFAWLSTFVNFDYVNEFLVYAHGAPDVKWMLEQIDDISRRTVGDKQIKVAYGGVIWPLEWYMREYPNRAFFGSQPNRDALDAPVVVISPDPDVALGDVEPYLGDKYRRFDYRQVWWPIEDYKNLSFGQVWRDYISPDPELEGGAEIVQRNRESLWNIIFYRDHINHTFKDWPYRTQMYFFVRKDVLNDLWDYRTGPLTAQDFPLDPYEGRRQTLPAIQVWGGEGVADGQFRSPRAVAVSPFGQVYVADGGNHRIQVFDLNGQFLKAWGGVEGEGPGELTEPWGIAVSDDGRIYVADTWNHRIQIFDEDGQYLSEFGDFANTDGDPQSAPGTFWGPRGLALDSAGNLYVADTGNKRIQKFASDGRHLSSWGGGGIIAGHFEEPTDVALDSAGNIYVADTWNQRIQKFDPQFNFIKEWPVVGWDGQNITNKPYLTIDGQDNVYISDPVNFRIIAYNAEGEVLQTFGQFGAENDAFRLPLGLAFAEDGHLFVVDSDNQRLMKFMLSE